MVPRIEFENEMLKLHQEITHMGARVEQALDSAITALIEMDAKRAQDIMAEDDIIDAMEREIDGHCVGIIARQQPVASDLRDVTSTLKLITDLERIADHASDISEKVIALSGMPHRVSVPYDITRIVQMAQHMLKGALEAYVARDEKQAAQIILLDESVDELYHRLKRNLVHQMTVDSQSVPALVEMLLISKYAERVADHAQNVAEWVLYYIQGRHR